MKVNTIFCIFVLLFLTSMTTDQLDSIISHYKKKAVHAYNEDDTYTCNRMISIVHDLEDNYDDYLGYDYENDYLDLYFNTIMPKVEPSHHPLFHVVDPYSDVDTEEALEWMDDWEEGGDDDFDDDFDLF